MAKMVAKTTGTRMLLAMYSMANRTAIPINKMLAFTYAGSFSPSFVMAHGLKCHGFRVSTLFFRKIRRSITSPVDLMLPDCLATKLVTPSCKTGLISFPNFIAVTPGRILLERYPAPKPRAVPRMFSIRFGDEEISCKVLRIRLAGLKLS